MRLLLTLMALLTLPTLAREVVQSDYLPIREGLEWTMDMEITTPDGKVQKATGRRKMEGSVEKDGKSYRSMRTWVEDSPARMETTKLVRRDDAGLYFLNAEGKEVLQIQLPLKEGASWRQIDGAVAYKVTNLGLETVFIGETTYGRCFHIRTESVDGKFREDSWEAPKIGCVKSETVLANGATITLSLRSFTKGKPARQ